jgi:hypothetical protein
VGSIGRECKEQWEGIGMGRDRRGEREEKGAWGRERGRRGGRCRVKGKRKGNEEGREGA